MKCRRIILVSAATAVFMGMTLNVSAAQSSADKYVNRLKKSGQVDLILDVEAYRAAYSDLEEAFGDDEDAYIKHYLTAGVYEGRTKGVLFDPLAYAEGYDDIRDAFGDDILAIVTHYVTYGVKENRTVGTAAAYADAAAAVVEADVVQGAVQGGNSPVVSEGQAVQVPSGDQALAGASESQTEAGSAEDNSTDISYWRTTSIYANDNVTLLRVEYYDENNNLVFYSVVTDYDSSTKSYKEDIYSRDMEFVRTDTYVDGMKK